MVEKNRFDKYKTDSCSFVADGVEYALDVADRYAEESDERFKHEEIFSKLRGYTNG